MRQDGRVVVDDRVRDQPGALVADLNFDVSAPGQFLLPADLSDGRAQLVVRLDAVLRAMDITFQFWIAQVAQRVDTAHEFVELEDRAPRRVRRGVGAQLANQRALGHLLQPERGDNLIHVRFFFDDQRQVNLADRANQVFLVQRRVVGAIQFFQLIFHVGEARFEARAEPVQNGEVGLVDAVHVTGDRRWHDVGRIAIPTVARRLKWLDRVLRSTAHTSTLCSPSNSEQFAESRNVHVAATHQHADTLPFQL